MRDPRPDRPTTAAADTGHPSPGGRVTRRTFLVGSAVLAVAAACGDSDTGTTTATTTDATGTFALGVFFPPSGLLHDDGPQRLPFGLFVDGAPATFEQAPDSLEIRFVQDQAELDDATPIVAAARGADSGLPRPYYTVTHTFPATGTWYAISEVDGQRVEAAIEVIDREAVTVLGPGDDMPLIETPTFDDAHGVEPICTNDPPCPLHEVTVAGALDENAPLVLLISTPAFCQVAVCGPVLDLLLAEADRRDGVRFLHAEVFADPTVEQPQPAPVMTETGLVFEPALFLVGADGVITERLDVTYDNEELANAIDRLVAT